MDNTILTWAIGLCVTGFFALLALHGQLNDKVEKYHGEQKDKTEKMNVDTNVELQKRVTYDWIERKFEKEFANLTKTMESLEEAIIGTVDKKGILTKLHEHEDKIMDMEIEQKLIVSKMNNKE